MLRGDFNKVEYCRKSCFISSVSCQRNTTARQWKVEKNSLPANVHFHPSLRAVSPSCSWAHHQLLDGSCRLRTPAFERLCITYARLTHRTESHMSVCSLVQLQQVAAEVPAHRTAPGCAGGQPPQRPGAPPASLLSTGEAQGAAHHASTITTTYRRSSLCSSPHKDNA